MFAMTRIAMAVKSLGGSAGQVVFTTPGSGAWTVPAGVTSVCVVCVGPGGTGNSSTGGGGGALAYGNNIAVTPGATIDYNVGVAGASDTWFSSSAALVGGRGGNAAANGSAGVSGGTLRNGGGNGGVGGGSVGAGGAGGYSGSGQNGQAFAGQTSAATGGAAGGGSRPNTGGGGVGLLGQGASAAQALDYVAGDGGSGGSAGSGNAGGAYGGGSAGGTPGGGAIRIIWGAGRSFPSTNAFDSAPLSGQVVFDQPGTYSWIVPLGVTSISMVAVQPGGAENTTPAATTVTYNSTIVCRAQNGSRIGDGGGDGGMGGAGVFYGGAGGGAGGYSGSGGAGASGGAAAVPGSNGAGGGGAGGGINSDASNSGGGGVGLLGQGASGVSSDPASVAAKGGGGSGGADGTSGTPGPGGAYGGGAGAPGSGQSAGRGGALAYKNSVAVTPGQVVTVVVPSTPAAAGRGAVRIIWGAGLAYPSNASDVVAEAPSSWNFTFSSIYNPIASTPPTQARLSDGNSYTFWGSAPSTPQSLTADFGDVRTLRDVYYRAVPGDAPGGWGTTFTDGKSIQYSIDGTNWYTLIVISGSSTTTTTRYTLPSPVFARYVRLFGSSGSYAAVSEFHFA